MGNPFIGRRESVGIGMEATAGTAVAPQTWQRHLALTLDQKTTTAKNTSAMGRVEDVNDSAVTEQWAEGSLNGKITDIAVGYILANMFGSNSAATHSGETTVYDNTFTVVQNALPPSLTFARVNPIVSRRFAMGMLTDFELDVKQNDWAQFTTTLHTKVGQSSTETVAYVSTEHEFTSKHTVVKIASNLAGLTGATALQLKSIKLKISRKDERFTPLGQIDPTSFDPNEFSVTGTIVLRYTDTTIEALGLANTQQAMSIALVNTDATIGSTTNPSLTFTMPKMRFEPITLDNKLAQTLSQTINFTAELDMTSGYMIQALLTNTQNGYAHA